MIIAFLISARLQRVISEPILELARTARNVAQDRNYSIRVPNRRTDEIGTLVNGFNEMLEQIQQRDANLERRVQERTEELARSLSLLNATLESTADGIIASDRQGKVISLNTKFVALFGFPPDMVERRVPNEMRSFAARQMKDPDAFSNRYKNFLDRPETSSCEMEMKDGRVLERHAFPQYIGQNWVGVVVNWRDITVNRKAEEALRESEALYSSLVEQLPIGVYRKDAEDRYVFVNTRFCQLRGLSMDQIIGQSLNTMAPPEKAAQSKAIRNPAATRITSMSSNCLWWLLTEKSWAHRAFISTSHSANERKQNWKKCIVNCSMPPAAPAWPRWPPAFCTTSATC